MTNTLISTSARLFSIPETDLHPVRGGHISKVYGFSRDGREYILRLTPPGGDLDLASQKASLAWMAFLAGHGACVPGPVASIRGNLIELIDQAEGEWLAVVQTKATGILSEELPLEKWNAPLFEALGRAAGKLHSVARVYHPAGTLSRPGWEQCNNLFNLKRFPEPWLEAKAREVLLKIHSLPKSPENYGMIHADLHFGNFFVDIPSRTITIFDFDDICSGWFIMDLAILLFDVMVLYEGPDREAFALEFLKPFLHGYREVNDLDPFFLAQILIFIKLLEINIFAKMGPEYSPGSDWWMDKFMPGRKERIENDIPYLDIDFNSIELC